MIKKNEEEEEFDAVIVIKNTDSFRMRPKKATSNDSMPSKTSRKETKKIPISPQPTSSVNSVLHTLHTNAGALSELSKDDVEHLLIYRLFGYASRDLLVKKIVDERKTVDQALSWMKAFRTASYNNAIKNFNRLYVGRNIFDFVSGYHKSLEEKKTSEIEKTINVSPQIIYDENETLISCNKDYKGTVKIPLGIKNIEKNAFFSCEGIISVELPSTIEKIGAFSFKGCINLKKLHIPSSVKEIGIDAFDGIYEVHSSNWNYSSQDGALLSADHNILYSVPKKKSSFFIPYSTKIITSEAFQRCKDLLNISIPRNLKKICDYAFTGCSSLQSITIPEDIEYVGNFLFVGCTSLNVIILLLEDPCGIVQNDAFLSLSTYKTTIHVPEGCYENYEYHSAFRGFKIIDDQKTLKSNHLIEEDNAGVLLESPIDLPSDTKEEQIVQEGNFPWTDEEDFVLLDCIKEGNSIINIACLLERNYEDVEERLKQLRHPNNVPINVNENKPTDQQSNKDSSSKIVEESSKKDNPSLRKDDHSPLMDALNYYANSSSNKSTASGRALKSDESIFGNFVIKKRK